MLLLGLEETLDLFTQDNSIYSLINILDKKRECLSHFKSAFCILLPSLIY